MKHNVLEENLSKKELESLKNLSKNPDIVIQKSDKGNSVVILDKKVYLEKMKEMLNKNDQFLKLSIQEEKHYNFLINLEKKIREPLKELYQLDIIDKKTYDKLCPVGSHFGILYGLAKVHKQLINNCPPFRPILSAIGTPTYNIAKFLVPILKPLTTNDYTLKDTFEFSRDILNQNPNLFMASLDVDSLFTNIPLDETINIIIEKLFSENETVHNLNKDQFKCLLTLATKESYFLFDGELYQQVDSVAMGSPQGPTLANIFLCHYEDIWLRNCSLECKPSYNKRYVDNIFVLFELETQSESFKNFKNTCHPKMKFTFEKEQDKCFSFLDVKVIRENNVFTTSVYRKPLFSSFYYYFLQFCHML